MVIRLLTTLLTTLLLASASGEPQVGQKAPDFSLPDNDGGTFTLSEQKKVTVVVFYPRAFTGG